MYYIYILECSDGSFYTGYTNDVKKRLQVHNSGNGAKYTRGRLPAQLVYFEIFDTKSEAMKRECEIKSLSRPEKIKLIDFIDKKEIQILLQI